MASDASADLADAAQASASSPTVAQPADGLGSFGVALTRYHAGDAMGFLGLLLSIATIAVAQSARRAAKAALDRRDVLEVASLLSELVARIGDVRTVLAGDNWAGLSEEIDRAARVATRVASSSSVTEDSKVAGEVRKALRATQKATSGIKDASKHTKLRRTHDEVLVELLDSVESAHVVRLKHDDITK